MGTRASSARQVASSVHTVRPLPGKEAALPLYVATSCIAGAEDAVEALVALERRGIAHAAVMPGRPPGRGWSDAAARWSGRLLLHAACLEARQDQPCWNLAAEDADWRRHSLNAAVETLARAADAGAPFYSVHAGHALEVGLGRDGRPLGAAIARERALDRLASSLDRLASAADDHGLGLLVENAAGRRAAAGRGRTEVDPAVLALGQEPAELVRTLERVGAPMLGVQLDVAHWLLACHARRWEPEQALEELLPRVRAIEVSATDGRADLHRVPREEATELALARQAGGLLLPVVFEAWNVPAADLPGILAMLEEFLRPATQVGPLK